MRVLIDVRHIKDFGIGTYIRNLLHALAAIDNETQYSLVTNKLGLDEFAGLGPNFTPVEYSRTDSDPRDHYGLPWLARRCRADLVHIPLNSVPMLLPRPYVVTVHDVSSLLFGRHQHGLVENLHLYATTRGLSRASSIIAVSAATRRDLHEFLGIPSERIRIIYSAPDPRFYDAAPSADTRLAGPGMREKEKARILERYQIEYPFLLYAGTIRPQKNIPRLIDAFALVRGELEHHPEWRELRLIIIGDELFQNPAVRRAVIQAHVENYVRFLGFVPFATLRVFHETAAAFVFPSLYEGFGLAPLEAMASGTPVVTSNVGPMPESVGDAALKVHPENVFEIARAIQDVLFDQDLRHRLIERGYAHSRTFSWQRTAAETLATYREIAGN
jgi:glycosyltransferase involved in cell wall biosynthesis